MWLVVEGYGSFSFQSLIFASTFLHHPFRENFDLFPSREIDEVRFAVQPFNITYQLN